MARWKSMSKATRNIVSKMEENKHSCFCGCCDKKRYSKFILVSIVIAALLYVLISIMTPIAGCIAGKTLEAIFEKYTPSEINTVCNGNADLFVWNGNNIGVYGLYMLVFGCIDLLFSLCFATCTVSYFMNPRMETDRVCIGM